MTINFGVKKNYSRNHLHESHEKIQENAEKCKQ